MTQRCNHSANTHPLMLSYPFHHCLTSASSLSIGNSSFFSAIVRDWFYPCECKDIAWLQARQPSPEESPSMILALSLVTGQKSKSLVRLKLLLDYLCLPMAVKSELSQPIYNLHGLASDTKHTQRTTHVFVFAVFYIDAHLSMCISLLSPSNASSSSSLLAFVSHAP